MNDRLLTCFLNADSYDFYDARNTQTSLVGIIKIIIISIQKNALRQAAIYLSGYHRCSFDLLR